MGSRISRRIIIALFCCFTMVASAETGEGFLQWQKLPSSEQNPANPDEFEVNYKLVNVSKQDMGLKLTRINHAQMNIKNQNSCTMPLHLNAGESCHLNLYLSKQNLSDPLELCEDTDGRDHTPQCIKLNRHYKILNDKASSADYLPLKVSTDSTKNKKKNLGKYARTSGGCTLELIAGTDTTRTITVTNIGSRFAKNIRIHGDLEGGVIATYENCDEVGPGQSCVISVKPGDKSITQTLIIKGINTAPVGVTIIVVSAIEIRPTSSTTIFTNGGTGEITIASTSRTKTLSSINADFSNFEKDGQSVSITASNCQGTLTPDQECTLGIQSNNDVPIQPARDYTVSAVTNNNISVSATAKLEITTPPPIMEMPWGGGVLFEINKDRRQGKVATLFEVSDTLPEEDMNRDAFAADACSKLAISDKEGNIYNDWYAPSVAERRALAEGLKTGASAISRVNELSDGLFYQNNKLYLRCIREFIIN